MRIDGEKGDYYKSLIDKLNLEKKIIAIVGPTASGKSRLALELAEILDVEIISADSRQVYKYLDIGTAKPNKSEQEKIKHHLIDIIEPNEYYSAGGFEADADRVYAEIVNKGKLPLLVGGSGLYINAFINGIFDEDEVFCQVGNSKSIGKENLFALREKVKKQLVERFEKYGIYDLYIELEEVDAVSAKKYEDKNPVRVIRALEFYQMFQKPISQVYTYQTKKAYKPIYFQVDISRQELYERINLRTVQMIEQGWVQEVEQILGMGYDYELNSLNTVGYKEIIDYLNEDNELYGKKDLMIEKIQQKTRNYAKRQITWFKKFATNSVYVKDSRDVLNYLKNMNLV